jgi:hypothetical protein
LRREDDEGRVPRSVQEKAVCCLQQDKLAAVVKYGEVKSEGVKMGTDL